MTRPIPPIVLVRHGVTPANEHKEVRAWGDFPLDVAKATPVLQETARRLRQAPLHNPVYTSDLRRAKQSAQILADELLLEVVPDLGLRTWNLGDFEGQPSEEIVPILKELIKHPDTPVRGGERHIEFVIRWAARFHQLVARAVAHPEVWQVAVTHSSNIEAARDIAKGKRPQDIQFGDTVKPGEATLWQVVNGKLVEHPLAAEYRGTGE
jgi:broad specificity phosphatase PhoE